MFGLGLPEIVIILVAVVVLFFGGKKLSELARGVGRFSGEFKKGKMDIEEGLKEMKEEGEKEDGQKEDESRTK